MNVRGLGRSAFGVGWTGFWAGRAVVKSALTGRDHVTTDTPRWASGLARAWRMPVRSFGGEALDPEGPYVFMANHQSHVDIVALYVALPVQPGFLAKKELSRVPVLGRAMEVSGHVFIDRSRKRQAFAAIAEAAEQVREGRSLVIFPEGTRGDDEIIRPLKKGGFHLAKQAGVPVVPVGIRGTHHIMAKGSRTVERGGLEVHIGRPIAPDEVGGTPLPEVMARVRGEIGRLAAMPLAETPPRRSSAASAQERAVASSKHDA